MRAQTVLCLLLLSSAVCLSQTPSVPPPSTQPDAPTAQSKPEAVSNTTEQTKTEAPAEAPAPTTTSTPVVAVADAVPAIVPAPGSVKPIVSEASKNQMLIDYVKTDLKWRLGFRKEPYNKLSGHTGDVLGKALEAKELKIAEKLDDGCCKIMIELLQVSTRQAMIKDPGIDVAANLTVSDAKGKVIYSKGYRGRSGTYFMNTWGHLIDHACENMVENMVKDELLLSVLRNGKMPE